jgi:hypothetical protein
MIANMVKQNCKNKKNDNIMYYIVNKFLIVQVNKGKDCEVRGISEMKQGSTISI